MKIDQPINVVALLGLAFLLFLAGLEIDLRATTRVWDSLAVDTIRNPHRYRHGNPASPANRGSGFAPSQVG